MGKVKVPDPVKLIVGIIFKDKGVLVKAEQSLIRRFGETDFQSPFLPFHQTDYYQEEMGRELQRKFISFQKLLSPENISPVKIYTNGVEKKLSREGKRRVNLDPGYLSASKLVLASTKNYSHRLYLGKGIYAEIALFYKEKGFRALPWTYPDYRSDGYLEVFREVRKIYLRQLAGSNLSLRRPCFGRNPENPGSV